ncbi:response regulator transcription factor [Singulisphaera sp. Ch08]|uniref:Response regulator transcription factor n=1 Tax=Singulisphaera sp. Ch08 TaxID=3120278 RepID=A0AAU7CLA2_9BACT
MDSRVSPGEAADPPAPSILLIDDDVELCELLREFFAEQDILIESVHDGPRGLSRALGGGYDLLLLDVMMPGLDGFALLRQMRRQSQLPVIMLTARTAKADRLAGLDAGADDYVPKPFDPDELLARIRAVLRRSGRAPNCGELLEIEELKLITAAREVWCAGTAIPMTTIEYDILEFLARAAGRVVSRDELMSALYQRRASPYDRAIDVHVSRLRKKLGMYGSRIVTVRGVGYLYRSGPTGEDAR